MINFVLNLPQSVEANAKVFFRDPLYGYQTILYCALDDDVIQYSGDYFEDCARVELMSHAKNASMGKWLWDESMKITGLV